ncbi:RNA-directed DNA polymerase from mobile element jockey-like, partial [Brachionus plicatilis]
MNCPKLILCRLTPASGCIYYVQPCWHRHQQLKPCANGKRRNEQPTSKLDLLLVSDPNRVTDVKTGPPLDGNASKYHCSLIFQLHSKASRLQTFDSRSLNWRNGDFMAMSEYFKSNFRKVTQNGCPQDLYSDFLYTFGEAAKLFVKRRRTRLLNSKPPWWNSEIATLVRQKIHVFICKRIDRHNQQLASKHKYLCKQVKHVVKRSIIEYELKLVQSAKKNPKLLYSYMNRHYSSRESIVALMDVDNHIVTDKIGICERLNDFFFSVFEPPTSREARQLIRNCGVRHNFFTNRTADFLKKYLILKIGRRLLQWGVYVRNHLETPVSHSINTTTTTNLPFSG